MESRKQILITVILILLALVSTFIVQLHIFFTWINMLFGGITILFLPGYWLSISLIKGKEVDIFERVLISFVLSIALVSMLTYFLSLIYVPISLLTVLAIGIIITACELIFIRFKVL